jgi:hypothetical protein
MLDIWDRRTVERYATVAIGGIGITRGMPLLDRARTDAPAAADRRDMALTALPSPTAVFLTLVYSLY